MRFNDPVDHRAWGVRLLDRRSPDDFRAYGAQTGLSEFFGGWNHFKFSRDARNLAFTVKKIRALAQERYDHVLDGRLDLPGPYEFEDPRRVISPRERNAWLNGFFEAYQEALDDHVSSIIPDEIMDKLGVFCSVVGIVQHDAEKGHDYSDWGVELGKKKQEIVKIHPNQERLLKTARRNGIDEAERDWGWQQTGSYSIRRPSFIHAPFDWALSQDEERLYEEEFEKSFFTRIREILQKFVPAKVWKNAFLICSLYDEMQSQKHEGRRTIVGREGWSYLRSFREHDRFMTEQRKKQEEEAFAKRYHRAPLIKQADFLQKQAADQERLDLLKKHAVGSPSLGAFISKRLIMTPGAREAFESTGDNPERFLDRFFNEDFGEIPKEDLEINKKGARTGGMVMGIYRLSDGEEFYIITDDGHDITTILLPMEY